MRYNLLMTHHIVRCLGRLETTSVFVTNCVGNVTSRVWKERGGGSAFFVGHDGERSGFVPVGEQCEQRTPVPVTELLPEMLTNSDLPEVLAIVGACVLCAAKCEKNIGIGVNGEDGWLAAFRTVIGE